MHWLSVMIMPFYYIFGIYWGGIFGYFRCSSKHIHSVIPYRSAPRSLTCNLQTMLHREFSSRDQNCVILLIRHIGAPQAFLWKHLNNVKASVWSVEYCFVIVCKWFTSWSEGLLLKEGPNYWWNWSFLYHYAWTSRTKWRLSSIRCLTCCHIWCLELVL